MSPIGPINAPLHPPHTPFLAPTPTSPSLTQYTHQRGFRLNTTRDKTDQSEQCFVPCLTVETGLQRVVLRQFLSSLVFARTTDEDVYQTLGVSQDKVLLSTRRRREIL